MQQNERAAIAANTTVAIAAKALGVKPSDVHNLITAGLLNGEMGKGITNAQRRKDGFALQYARAAKLVSPFDINDLKSEMATISRTRVPAVRPGRPPSLLRLAAESIAERKAKAREVPPAESASERDSPAWGQSENRGGRPRNKTSALYAFCYEQYHEKDLKASVVRERARAEFGSRCPKTDSEIIRNANRYADREGKPRLHGVDRSIPKSRQKA